MPQAELNQLVLAGLVLAYAASLYDRRDVMRLVVGERYCRRAAVALAAVAAALVLNAWLVHLPIPDRVLPDAGAVGVHMGEWAEEYALGACFGLVVAAFVLTNNANNPVADLVV